MSNSEERTAKMDQAGKEVNDLFTQFTLGCLTTDELLDGVYRLRIKTERLCPGDIDPLTNEPVPE